MKEDISKFFMDNYAERSSLGTIMGPLYMILRVCHDKDGVMVSFLWKLWASLVCGKHVGSDHWQSGPHLEANFGS